MLDLTSCNACDALAPEAAKNERGYCARCLAENTPDAAALPSISEIEGETFTIDLTPASMKTPEGIKRVNDAMDAWHNAQATLANNASQFLEEHGATLRFYLAKGREGDASETVVALNELDEQRATMARLQETFLRAVAGRPL